ncbi:MAG: hypothetical protein NC191_01825 [Muribaculaceae bacterium]|nr:hypothetical protein [Muribaculaceae bacterium]
MKKRYYISAILTIILLALTYKFWIIKDCGKYLFQCYQFLVILICGYLVSLKITTYLADFKTLKHQSRIDIIFLTLFFTMLFVPMSHISNKKISVRENRTLAKWHPFITKGKINYKFGKDYEAWFNDRFWLRREIISLHNKITGKSSSEKIIFGENNWIFLKEDIAHKQLYTQNELKEITTYLIKADKVCKKENKQFYFFIAPDKSSIYGKHYPKKYKNIEAFNNYRTKQLVDYIKTNSEVSVIYPYQQLQEEKNHTLIYWKHDSHWTPIGAYIGYKELMKPIINKNKNINIYKTPKYINETISEDKTRNDLERFINGYVNKDNYTYRSIESPQNFTFKIRGKVSHNLKDTSHTEMETINDSEIVNAVVYRDSFFRSIIPYFAQSFKHVNYHWKYQLNEDELKNSDIVILEVVERLIPKLLQGSDFKGGVNNAI